MSNAERVEQYWEEDLGTDDRTVAFQVEDANAADSDDTAIPTSAAEYLRMVRRQAASLPNVFVSDPALTASATKSAPDAGDSPAIASTRMAPMPDFARPDADWQRQFLGWFADLKETLVAKKTHFDGGQNAKRNLPDGSKGSHQQWRRLIFDEAHYIEPSGDVLMQMEFAQINAALQTLDSCLGDVHSVPRSGPVPDACREDGRRICVDVGDERRSKWLFSLLANLDTPLPGTTAGTLRSILRKLTFARLDVKSRDDERLATLNVLIVILAHHFGQGAQAAFKT